MSTEHNNPAGTPEPGNNGGAPTYTPEQQAHIDDLINKRTGKIAAGIRAELTTEMNNKVADMQAKLDAAEARAAKPNSGKADEKEVEELRAKVAEAENRRASYEATLKSYETTARESEQKAKAAEQRAQDTLKEVEMSRAASKIPFFDQSTVIQLTKGNVAWDADRNTFVVKNEQGNIRMDSTLENPLTLEAYLTEYAAKNKYFVKSDVIPGAGGSPGTRSDLSNNGRFDVADVFGPKSDASKASRLMKDNPGEYHRLKGLAKQAGLIA